MTSAQLQSRNLPSALAQAVARQLGERLHSVRLDTSAAVADKCLQALSGDDLHGVNPTLVKTVRAVLDAAGFSQVGIVVSGGLTPQRIAHFVAADAQVDAFGLGSSVVRNSGTFDFTADIVEVDGKAVSKAGRELRPNVNLKRL